MAGRLIIKPHTLSSAAPGASPSTIPLLVYGTAWKKLHTKELVAQALRAGFTGIDTAAQPKHYREDLVGEGIREVLAEGNIQRQDLYIQTKFTSVSGQNINDMPYNPEDPLEKQVLTSVESSLHNLRTSGDKAGEDTYLDCLVLHSPMSTREDTLTVWRTLEKFITETSPPRIRHLGISNVPHVSILRDLYEAAQIKPSVVQNRFHAETGYDRAIRRFCEERGMVYQSFWTLTANPHLLNSLPVQRLAQKAEIEKEVALYCLVLGLKNTVVLDGTTNEGRMKGDLAGVKKVSDWIRVDGKPFWEDSLGKFMGLINRYKMEM